MDVQYPILRQEFRKCGGSNIEICSGRHEGSFLISFRKAEDLWSALSAHKGGEPGMRNLKLVFKDDTACEERKVSLNYIFLPQYPSTPLDQSNQVMSS